MANLITIVPTAGLCNRMRAINGAASMAEQAGTSLRIEWWSTSDLNAPYSRLFDRDLLSAELVERSLSFRAGLRILEFEEKARRLSPKTIVVTAADSAPDVFDAETIVKAAASGRSVWIRSLSKLHPHPRPFSMFAPSEEVRSLMATIPALGEHAEEQESPVGVHIRRTDNELSIANSPMSAFEGLIDAEIRLNPGQRFFVATDDPSAFAHLQQRYGEAVSEYPKRSYARSHPDGVVDAAVDFWALTRCRKIIGSYYSSFTETAALTAGAELVMALET